MGIFNGDEEPQIKEYIRVPYNELLKKYIDNETKTTLNFIRYSTKYYIKYTNNNIKYTNGRFC